QSVQYLYQVTYLSAFVLCPTRTAEIYTLSLHDALPILFRRVVESVTPSSGNDRVQLPPTSSATPAQLALRRQHAMGRPAKSAARSEEHTSELQSRENIVCRLLLEKKKKYHELKRIMYLL